ncbi:hypothetical protein JH06_5230 [Blastocystis sp. subtype 4]|uniref:hypothetical protein n=1 Tax=Blastocystis sp. subtype 4 TaxID=944170 RepID=UPI000711B3D8|nr:hypothetical protein JH06_5230 [Blastocystis sp. subtype 4]KNB43057.1 hypothetical protein JH06_5230 [Blastocystis sp. subtype 4]|eukprot:XP_014526500.1 hypothetical protein JH06_5230 [Blastocystis sp. subtype 4]
MKRDFKFTLTDESGENEYLDDATVMKNTSVLYKIEPLKDGEIGIMRKINSLGKRPPRREMNLVSGPSNVLSTVSSMNSLPQGSSSLRPLPKTSMINRNGEVVHGKDEIPPPEYLCSRCYVKGHFEENCPTLMDSDWLTKMRKWNFMMSRGIPTDRLVRIEDPLSVETLLKLGKTIVRHPIYKHLCTVEKMKNSQPTTTMKWKVSSRCSVILRSSGGVLNYWFLSCLHDVITQFT